MKWIRVFAPTGTLRAAALSPALVRSLLSMPALMTTGDPTPLAAPEPDGALPEAQARADGRVLQLELLVQRLLQESREKSDLLRMAAHDLRGPLGAIMGLAEQWLADEAARKGSGDPEFLEVIRDTARSSIELVNGVLDVHAISSGRRTPQRVPVDVVAVLQQSADLHSPRAVEKEIVFAHLLPPEGVPLLVQTDPVGLRQILDNLISNAVKYTPRRGVVEVAARRAADRIHISIVDTGPGFTAEDRKRMYQPFARLSAQPTGGEHSVGLGLHLAQRLARDLEIELHCHTTRGEGTRFELSLPAA